MKARYALTMEAPDNQLPEAEELVALVRAALAALPEYHALEIDVVRTQDSGEEHHAHAAAYGHDRPAPRAADQYPPGTGPFGS